MAPFRAGEAPADSRGGRYLLTDDDHGILGRDVLASLRLLFDGPQEE